MPPSGLPRFNIVRWSIYTILVLTYMLAFFHRMAPAVISADLMQAFATSGAALGSLAAMYFYIFTAMQIPVGVTVCACTRLGIIIQAMLAFAAVGAVGAGRVRETNCRNSTVEN